MAVYLGSNMVLVNGGQPLSSTVYDGEYFVTPDAYNEQTLSTAHKLLLNDVVVHRVPYYETANTSGETVYIASEV